MNERWECPKCGFRNDYEAGRCVSCDTPRPDPDESPDILERPDSVSTDGYSFTSTLRDLDYLSQPAKPPSFSSVTEDEPRPSKPLLEYDTSPTFEPRLPQGARQPRIRRRKEVKRVAPPVPTTKGSPLRKALIIMVASVALISVAASIITHFEDDRSDTTTPSVNEVYVSYPQDDDYLNDFDLVNNDRNELIDTTNSRWNSWLELESEDLPGDQYLVAQELIAFRDRVLGMDPPVSAELAELHQTWVSELLLLVDAEQTLATEPTQAALDVELQAWDDEYEAYSALYDYIEALEQ